ncbi:MAG: MFS transporter, partial [Bacilli bacterium]
MASKKTRYFQLALLILAAGAIYPMVYLRTNFQETILTVFNMRTEELSDLYSVLGMMFIIGYLPSGWLADRVSTKKLLVFSLSIT